ncbi:MAG: hypothetical protein WD691_09955 [Acidimicrobiales bacterium]
MTPGPDDGELLAAREVLAEAERAAVDEVLALRAEATELYAEVVALRAEAAQLVAQATAQADQVRAEQVALEAVRSELDQRALSVVTQGAEGGVDDDPSPLVGAQAEMRALSELLDELQGRVEELGQRAVPGEDPP